jgi:hypothetical protein
VSINIAGWHTIILRNLRIPISQFDKEDIRYWVRPAKGATTGKEWLAFESTEGDCELDGTLENQDRVHVKNISLTGESSSWFLERLQRMLVMSTGRLRAFLVWETGEFSLLDSDGGRVKCEVVDILEVYSEGGIYDQQQK